MDYAEGFGLTESEFPMGAQTQVAAGAGDNTEVTPSSGALVHPPNSRHDHISGVLVISGRDTLTAAKHATLVTVKESESDDNSSWGSDTTLSAYSGTVLDTGAQTAHDWKFKIPINLKGKKAYVRYKITIDLDAGSADVNSWSAVLVCNDTEMPSE